MPVMRRGFLIHLHSMKKKEYSLELGGKSITATFTDLAEQADASVIIRHGDTALLVTAVMSPNTKEVDFLPLSVEYEEKFYASGKILGSRFTRREGKPSEAAMLSGRIIDRTLRPLFDNWIRNEIQVVVTALAIDEKDTDSIGVLGVIGASLALSISPIPWNGPVSATRITLDDPAGFDLVACGKDGNINMIELAGREVSEEAISGGLLKATQVMEKIQDFQKKIIAEIGMSKKSIPKPEIPAALTTLFTNTISPLMESYLLSSTPGDEKIKELSTLWKEKIKAEHKDEAKSFFARGNELFEEKVNDFLHKTAIDQQKRADGRGLDEVRPLYAQAGGVSPILHGSGIFYRGQTHIFSALTLGGPKDAQHIEGLFHEQDKRYIHHYNFPPFSTGETGKIGIPNRRMVGHGALAEKALLPVLPPKESFPYTIRIVSEAFSSNGSTSMASVCGSTIALMDAGVPITRPVAGISSGVMIRDTNKYAILTDIQGPEDHYGDMDFKVAGTSLGVTAIQMDVKVSGIPLQVLTEAFGKAKIARLKILEVIQKEILNPRANISSNAPKIVTLKINPENIGTLIGPGGKTIKEIKGKSLVDSIEVEEDGTVFITGKNGTAEKAQALIKGLIQEFSVGQRFEGTITKILDFGAFVRIAEHTEGLVRISEIAPFHIEKIGDYLKEGQRIPVIIKEIDDRKRINLSIKDANPDFIQPKK